MSLTDEQQIALNFIKEGKSIFITGAAGTGKSYLLKHIIKYLKSIKKNIAVTGSTGCASVLIGGQTIHSYLNIKIDKKLETIVSDIKKFKPKISNLNVLIIDEISMLDDNLFEFISLILQKIKQDIRPFGGVQMILVGDFCQLPPVSGDYCFTSNIWNDLNPKPILLTKSIRQEGDDEFQCILNEIRYGKCSDETFKKLQKLEKNIFTEINPTRLYSLNQDVICINDFEFWNLYKKTYSKKKKDANIYSCYPSLTKEEQYLSDFSEISIDGIRCYFPLTNNKKLNLDEYTINLFKGLQVMLIRNINFDKQLINGTQGIITDLTNKSVSIDVKGIIHTIYYHTDINENNNTYIKFMPLKLAYAISIHKSQGATLDYIEIDGSTNIFAPGQLYTALSRARSLSSICLKNIDRLSIMCHASVKQFYYNITKI